jgi:hypothetical protein
LRLKQLEAGLSKNGNPEAEDKESSDDSLERIQFLANSRVLQRPRSIINIQTSMVKSIGDGSSVKRMAVKRANS